MTYRVYLRWPGQKTSDKTVTESRSVAELAFKELKAREDLRGRPVGLAFSEDGKQLEYVDFQQLDGASK